jgi:hypothetical protein
MAVILVSQDTSRYLFTSLPACIAQLPDSTLAKSRLSEVDACLGVVAILRPIRVWSILRLVAQLAHALKRPPQSTARFGVFLLGGLLETDAS